jgi:hypothetical protein
MTSKRRNRAFYLALGVVAFTASNTAMAEMTYFVNQAGGIDVANRDIDFTTASVPVGGSGVTAGLKTWTLDLSTNSNKSQCFQIWTAGDGNDDTRIWAYDSTINDYRSLNDDSNGTLYSAVNVWIVPRTNQYEYASVIVTGYSSAYNTMQFELIVHKLSSATTEAQCTQGIAALKQVQGVTTFVNAS